MGRTSRPGPRGRAAEAFASVVTAASAGLVAGAACVAGLLAIDHRVPVPA
ncbi:MAG: hypothetical protein JWM84_1851 [Nocardioides sp.]|nr:hypothetical protein [Nocardioides sp.]